VVVAVIPESLPAVLALVDLAGHDAQVVRVARALAGSSGATVTLLHVARPVFRDGTLTRRRQRAAWRRMAGIEAAAQRALRQLAARLLRPSIQVQTSVRFGDVVEQRAAMVVGATVVVASSGPARWLGWRSRDRRLRQSLEIPLVLVPAGGAERDGFPTTRHGSSSPRQSRSAA
jgi:nucleotide-binding universal stress UspA family protein